MTEDIRGASAAMLEAEQWLHAHGWRDPINEMAKPRADLWLAGYRAFRARVEVERDRAQRWSNEFLVTSVLAGLALFALGVWIGAGVF